MGSDNSITHRARKTAVVNTIILTGHTEGEGARQPDRLKPSVQSPGAQHCWASRAVCDTLNALLELPPRKLSVFLLCGF